jgi:hypothetical protein
VRKNNLGRLLVGYERTELHGIEGKSFFLRNVTGSVRSGKIGGTRLKRLTSFTSRLIAYTSARAYGLFLLGFGIVTMLVHFIKDYFGLYGTMPLSVLIVGTVLSILSIPLIAIDKPVGVAFQEFWLTDYVFFEFFAIKRMHPNEAERGINPMLLLLLGMGFGALGSIVSPTYIAFGLGAAVYLYLTFISPEFSFFLIFLAIPYISMTGYSEVVLSVMVGVTLVSFLRKVIAGKRVYSFEQYDLELFLMLCFILVSGIFVKGVESFGSSVVMIVLAMGYCLSGNLVVNRRLADCAINAITISSVPVSVIAVSQFVAEWTASGSLPSAGVSATFSSSSVLAVFMLVAFTFSAYFFKNVSGRAGKSVYGIIMILATLGLCATLQLWAAVSVVFGILAYCIARGRRFIGFLLGAVGGALYLLLFIPVTLLAATSEIPILSVLRLEELGELWQTSFRMFSDNLFVGVGMGGDSFESEIAGYSDTVARHSSNFFLEIGVEAGVFALAFFLILMLIRLIHRSRYRRYLIDSDLNPVSHTCSSVIISLIVFGVFNYVWEDMSMYYLFWCVFGIGSASLRIAKREYDDRVAYFSDGRSVHYSAVDIALK